MQASNSLPNQRFVQSGDVRLAVKTWGDPARPAIVLVHGYPDNSAVWHGVAPLLANDYYVVAYDVRGAGGSTAPKGVAAYRLERLAQDFSAVIDAVSPHAPVHLVGHDWGSIQCWEFVTEPRLRGRIASFTSCSGPCLDHVGHWMRGNRRLSFTALSRSLRQMASSWYIYLFHLPWLPELSWRLWMGRAWPLYLKRTERIEADRNPTQIADGCFGLALYRANMLPRLLSPGERHAHAPVQVIVPLLDRYVRPALSEDLSRWVGRWWRREVSARHWLPLADPAAMAAMVRDLAGHIDGGPEPLALRQARMAPNSEIS
ncbi:alpha/beta fold hydrolase [Cupriavidus sp. D39]|uniref:alpha/beta fold hydrolase n=1 Tax=Cupriavidus sp. D39 TaxID=2997877 RepID=UPI0022722D40|nr:alpha/beta fold hydrolase [Cupriavidus sp. D39]MCY0855502.1 alpha/beta fold hydrolase [Cupriavidus sp. D39]